jgi:CBS domain containing-hemolysin-like protein
MIAWLLVLAGVVVAAGLGAAQTAIASASRARLKAPVAGGGRGAWASLGLLAEPRRVAEASVVGSALGLVVASAVTAAWSAHAFPGDVAWIVAGVALALVIGTARGLAMRWAHGHAERAVPWLLGPLTAADAVTRPVTELAQGAARALLALVGVRAAADPFAPPRRGSHEPPPQSAPPGPAEMLQQVLDFGDTTLAEAMVPRTDVVGVEVGTPVREVVARIRQHRFSRLPVYREDLDHIVGLVHQFDLFRAHHPQQAVDELMRPIQFVPESKMCDDMLREMQQSGQGMAVVLDEFGGTSGIVTAEDLLEELVGELGEEEGERLTLRRVDERTAVADGAVRVDEANEALGLEIPEGDYETLAGYVLERLGRIPRRGEVVAEAGYRIEVLAADRRRIRSLRIERTGGGPASRGPEGS